MVGKTYAELIVGLLKDLATKHQLAETVYILELGTGHGRLAFHILKHLEKLISYLDIELPPYCYIVSDIVEENLSFYQKHPQFQCFLEQGLMDICYYDAVGGEELHLRYSGRRIAHQQLQQPLVVISNYFFDSIPTDLFHIHDQQISSCAISLHTSQNPSKMSGEELLNHLSLTYHKNPVVKPFYKEGIYNDLLEGYRDLILDSHIFFPHKSLQCLNKLKNLSKQGMMLLSMDKGFHELDELQQREEPKLASHGSFSIWVNYHALGQFL